jgi:two-component system, cell cycle sensor histidine kinase and response regulator CckA
MDQPRPLRLLIVDDSENDAALLVRHFSRGGYELTFERVDTPSAMGSALAVHWDLIVCDYFMPKFSGMEALNLLRSTGSEVPFIFVSGQIGEDNGVAALKQGAQDYVMKGNLKRLIPAVERELREVEQRRERKKLEQQVTRLEKFEAIGRLAGGIAHDFNNVVGAVLALAQLGYEEAPSGSRLGQRFQKICDQARYAAGLTAQLLAFARRQILQPRTLNLNDVIVEAANLLQTAIGEHIEFNTVLAPNLLATSADPTQMQQMLINLCLNARDAMPERGRFSIESENAEIGEEVNPNPPSPSCPGSYVLLKVSDTGVGMDAVTLDRIFEPFFSTKEVGRGTGLGLATVYGIVKQHGGFIRVASEPGRGTIFYIYLPAVSGVFQPPESVMAEQVLSGTGTILVAEDFEDLRELAYEILSSSGYRVILANNGQDAVRLFKASPEDIQLVVLDVVMPQLGGVETYAQMCDIMPGLPVIFTTGHTEESAALKSAIQEGAVFLQKPYMPEALSRTVRSTLRKRTLNS